MTRVEGLTLRFWGLAKTESLGLVVGDGGGPPGLEYRSLQVESIPIFGTLLLGMVDMVGSSGGPLGLLPDPPSISPKDCSRVPISIRLMSDTDSAGSKFL